jgi:hypothetical protein
MTYCNFFNPDYYILYNFRIPGSGARFLRVATQDRIIPYYAPNSSIKHVATQDRVFPYYAPNSSIKHSKSDSKDCPRDFVKCKAGIIRLTHFSTIISYPVSSFDRNQHKTPKNPNPVPYQI